MWSPHLTSATVCNAKAGIGGTVAVQRETRLPPVSSLPALLSLNLQHEGLILFDSFFLEVAWWFKGLY